MSDKLSLEQVISICLLTPMGDPNDDDCLWGAPLFIWGDPGIGKSSRVHVASVATQLHFERVATPCHTAEDFGGIPVTTKEDISGLVPGTLDLADLLHAQIKLMTGHVGVRRACSLGQIDRLIRKGRGVLFFDEISRAPRQVQNAMFSVVQERYAGDELLPGGVRMICAANPAEQVIGAFETDMALANRFLHWEQTPSTAAAWAQYQMDKILKRPPSMINYKMGESIIKKDFNEVYTQTLSTWSGFLATRGALLHKIPAEGDPARSRGWPSERSHELAMRVVATCNCLGIEISDQIDLIQGCVGEGVTTEWSKFILNADLPTAEQMLSEQWDPDVQRLDRTHAAYSTLINHVITRGTVQEKQKCAVPAWRMLEKLTATGLSDIARTHAQNLIENGVGLACGNTAIARAASQVMRHLGDTGLCGIRT